MSCRAASSVFFISIAIVIGPTPPGTGVMYDAFSMTPVNMSRHKAYIITPDNHSVSQSINVSTTLMHKHTISQSRHSNG